MPPVAQLLTEADGSTIDTGAVERANSAEQLLLRIPAWLIHINAAPRCRMKLNLPQRRTP